MKARAINDFSGTSLAGHPALEQPRMDEQSAFFQAIFPLPDLEATRDLGARIAASLKPGDTVALEGELGAGKTTLARAILTGLGVDETVPSPTFTLVQSYVAPQLMISHYDLYRLKNPREMDELGMEEALEVGAVLVEWPERAGDRLPLNRLSIALHGEKKERRAALRGPSRWRELFHA
jgi:tRNA threonylcarbamoyl adenosine modification protein YjeE